MSPAMVEFRTPSAASPKLKPHRSRSQNPRKGQIFNSASPSPFDQVGIRSISDALGAGSGSMDRNPNEGTLHANFASPSPFPPSVPASGKPSPAPGLSKPRLVKVRKHLASPRVKAAVVPDSGIAPGFNPFRSTPVVSDPPDRAEDSGTQVLHDRLYTRKPFDPEAGTRVSENPTCPNYGSSECLNHQSTGFVFGAGSVSNSKTKDIGSGNIPGATSSFASEGAGKSEMGAFVFGSGVTKSSNLSQNLTGNSTGLNSGCCESLMSKSADFVFGAGTTSNSDIRNDRMRNTANNAFESTSEGGGNSDAGAFVFVGAVKNSSNLGRNSSLGSGEGSFSHLRDETRSPSNEDGYENIKRADHRSKADENNFIFGGSTNARSEGSRNSDAGVFVFGSAAKNSSDLCQKSSLGSDEGMFSQLPESGKLKLQSAGNEDGCGKTEQSDQRSKVEENNFIFGGSKDAPRDGSRKSDAGVFVFGTSGNNSFSSNQTLSLGSDEGSFSQLSDQMRKLNLQAAGKEDGFYNTKQADRRSKIDVDNIYFGGSNNFSRSSGVGTANKLPEETKLNTKSETSSQTTKDESADFAPGGFVFGSNSKTTSASSQMPATSFTSLGKSTASELPDGIKKSNTQGSRNHFSFTNTKEADCRHKVDVTAGFVFGSCDNVFVSSKGTAEDILPDDMKNIGRKTENSVGSMDSFFSPNGTTPFKFTFQAGKQGHGSSMGAVPQSQTHDHVRPSAVTTPSFHPSSPGPDFTFTSAHEGLETPHMEFRTQKQDASCFPKENLFTTPHQNMASGMRKEGSKGTRTRNRRGKSRQAALVAKQFFSREKVSQANPEVEVPDDYSPMDYSPYKESFIADQYSREASVASDESIHLVSRCASTDSHISVSVEGRQEDIVSAAQRLGINNGDLEHRELDEDDSKNPGERNFAAGSSVVVEQTSGFGNGCLESKYENTGLDSDSKTAAAETEISSFRSFIEREASEGEILFTSTSGLEDHGKSNYAFAPPHSVPGPRLASRRHYRRKSTTRTGRDSYNSMPNAKVPLASPSPKSFPVASTSVHPDLAQGPNGIPFVPPPENNSRAEQNEKPEASQEPIRIAAASIAAQEACEKWRFRGNQAYANGHLSKAENYYTRGVNSVSQNETSRSCIQTLMLCYSNRAATRMSLGRMREAINDCKMALAIDPNFLKAQVRVANCHLALGEIEDALKHFKKCLQSENDVNSNQKILIEASEGLKKAQQVANCMDQFAQLLLKRTMNDATNALQIISRALSISPHSEDLMKMKAEALLMLRSYEEVIQFCEQTVDSAKRNSIVTGADGQFKDADSSEYMKSSPARLWRWRLISKSYFCMGKLEEAVEILQKHEEAKIIADKYGDRFPESSTSLSATIRELLRLKAAGNEAFQAGRHSEAVEHYTAALACNTESRPFAAICFCNRAAAYQALGQITDAIADCSLAIALDANYPKAISRRATLHEMIRDYGQAANDLNRLISLLEKQLEDKDNVPGTHVRSTGNSGDLKRARLRLSTVEEEAKKGTPLDMYMILGIEQSCSAVDVKKAYRKAALRHHPDKAGYFIARSENADDGLWREVATEVHMYADRLFKMIGEAYTVLSDPTKRLQYDAEEEMRTSMKAYNGGSTPKTASDSYSSQYERSTYRRHWREYGSSHPRWSDSSSHSDW